MCMFQPYHVGARIRNGRMSQHGRSRRCASPAAVDHPRTLDGEASHAVERVAARCAGGRMRRSAKVAAVIEATLTDARQPSRIRTAGSCGARIRRSATSSSSRRRRPRPAQRSGQRAGEGPRASRQGSSAGAAVQVGELADRDPGRPPADDVPGGDAGPQRRRRLRRRDRGVRPHDLRGHRRRDLAAPATAAASSARATPRRADSGQTERQACPPARRPPKGA